LVGFKAARVELSLEASENGSSNQDGKGWFEVGDLNNLIINRLLFDGYCLWKSRLKSALGQIGKRFLSRSVYPLYGYFRRCKVVE
jgi:hypothetical protein